MSELEPQSGPQPEDGSGEVCEGDEPELERRLRAMEAARPETAQPLHHYDDPCEAEIAQLLGFEAGLARWWELADSAALASGQEGAAEERDAEELREELGEATSRRSQA